MTYAEICELVSQVSYKPGWIVHTSVDGDRPFIQLWVGLSAEVSLDSTDRTGTKRSTWKSGKRYLSTFMCRQEVVGTIFDLIKSAELHETHEWFRYKGASIYNPHLDPDVLAKVASKKSSFVTRENAMSMEEGV